MHMFDCRGVSDIVKQIASVLLAQRNKRTGSLCRSIFKSGPVQVYVYRATC